MNNSNSSEISIDKSNIEEVYIDQKRNITITLKDHTQMVVERGDKTKEIYNELSGDNSDDD